MQRLSLGSPAGRSFRLSVAGDEEAEAADEKAAKAVARSPAPDKSIHLVPVLTLLCLLVLFLLSHDPSAALTGMSPSPCSAGRPPTLTLRCPLSLIDPAAGDCFVCPCRFARAGRGRHRHRTLLGGHRCWRRRRCVPKPPEGLHRRRRRQARVSRPRAVNFSRLFSRCLAVCIAADATAASSGVYRRLKEDSRRPQQQSRGRRLGMARRR